jgi:hypothetical protein
MKNSNTTLREFSDGNLYFWVEDGTSFHIKALSSVGDPVELSRDELAELISSMNELLETMQ